MAKIQFLPAGAHAFDRRDREWTGATLADGADLEPDVSRRRRRSTPAGPGDLTFLDNPRYRRELSVDARGGGACCSRAIARRGAGRLRRARRPPQPYRAMAEVMTRLYPSAARPGSGFGETRRFRRARIVHPSARLEPGVIVDPGAVIGPGGGDRRRRRSSAPMRSSALRVRIGRDGAIGAVAPSPAR